MEFYVYETREIVKAKHRPLVIITSNNEKELPDAFLRRCFFHYIKFPDKGTMRNIVDVHFPHLKKDLLAQALKIFYQVGEVAGLKKKPLPSELLDWLKLLLAEDIPASLLCKAAMPKLSYTVTWRITQKRTWCASIRTTGLHGPQKPLTVIIL